VETIDGKRESDVATTAESIGEDKEISAAVKAINDDDEIADENPLDAIDKKADVADKKMSKIPNFSKFRKKLLLIISGAVALTILIVWLFVFAPSATITIEAKNESIKVDQAVFLSPDENTDAAKYRINAQVKETKKTSSVEFEATGEKPVGERATGKVELVGADGSVCTSPFTVIPKGTVIFISSQRFTLDGNATLSWTFGSTSCVANNIAIVAEAVGEEYNVTGGGAVAGFDGVTATGAASGGSKRIVKIISPTDVDKAVAQLKDSKDNSSIRSDLYKQFSDDITVINESFKVTSGEARTEPAVGAEVATGKKAKASVEITYSMMGVTKSDLEKVLNAAILSKLGNREQRQIFSSGIKDLQILSFNQSDGEKVASVRLVTTAKVGPKIDEEKVKEEAVGKKTSEVSESLKKIDGVKEVKVELFPFWLTNIPSKDRIKVVFSVE